MRSSGLTHVSEDLQSWLHLRESADAAARSAAVTEAIVDALDGVEPLRVLDLATGTGSNVRYLIERLPGRQDWLVIDRSAALLEDAVARTCAWAAAHGYEVRPNENSCVVRGRRLECHVETRQADLGTLEHPEIFAGRHLVTASALLDLVSEAWLERLAIRCREVGAAALFTITYDGRSTCTPPEAEDEMVRELLNRHQKGDRGLGGSAAGPDAAEAAARAFVEAGYLVRRAPSDWVLGFADRELQRRLIDGWAQAATELAPGLGPTIVRWHARRLEHVDAARSQIVVGHDDMGAWLPKPVAR
jgi:hypothetical protein